MQISPSLLSADFTQLGQECSQVLAAGADMLHFDVMDGVFVPNISFGLPVLQSLSTRVKSVYDVHLMIENPIKYFSAFAKAGADIITFHCEAVSDMRAAAQQIQALGCKAGVSIKPNTSEKLIFDLLPYIDLVLVMSVEPGFGGQSFNSVAIDKIKNIKDEISRRCLPVLIEVDGGIDSETAQLCHRAGSDILVAGSYIFGQSDYVQAIKSLKN